LDALLAVAPAAIAAPLSFYAGGVGVAETVIVAGPIVEQFLARVIEYQFGDAMFDFLSPWKAEQQRALEEALVRHVLNPGMHQLTEYCEVLRGETVAELKQCQEQCAQALLTS
jgi:hypothetical protein